MSRGQFRDQDFKLRFAAMGDEAEGVFEAVYPEGWARYGINRPPVNLTNVPPKIRYTPDYLTAKGLVEVQGFGRDQTFKLKHDKYDALWQWHEDFRTDLFVWDCTNRRYGWVRLTDLPLALNERAATRLFPEGKPYWALLADDLPLTESGWHPYEPQAA